MNSLVSVIVPIYNVEKYLNRCIDSILRQTYKNIEIILIDDGSPDNCPAICDEYKLKDNRIKVIHQKNGGLSAARNAGIDIAKGSFITCIDSDDWISDDYIEIALNSIEKNNADVFSHALMQYYESGLMIPNSCLKQTIVMDKMQALSTYLFNDYLTTCMCGKIWKAELWEGVRHPVGKLFEDQFTIYKLLEKADKVVFDPTPRYYYFKRDGSIGHSKFTEKTYDLHFAANESYNYLASKYPSIESDLALGKIFWEIVFVNMMLNANVMDRKVVKDIQSFAKSKLYSVIKSEKFNFIRKFQITLFSVCLPAYKIFYKIYKKKKQLG